MTFKLVRKPKSAKFLYDTVRQEVAKALKPIAKASEDARNRVVSNWENKPVFKSEIIVGPDTIRVITKLQRPKRLSSGSGDTNKLWRWVDQTGTRPHTIRPKRPGGKLAFRWGGPGSYQSKTGARPARYGGPGTVRGAEMAYRKFVNHPGFPARNFTEAINRDLRAKFNQAVDKGYRNGFRKVSGR